MSLNKQLLAVGVLVLAVLVLFALLRESEPGDVSQSEPSAQLEEPPVLQAPPSAAGAPADPTSLSRIDAGLPVPAPEPGAAATPRTGSLRVHLVGTEGAPLPGIGVALKNAAEMLRPGTLVTFVPSDEQGAATFEGLAPGPYSVELDRAMLIAAAEVSAGERQELILELDGVRVDGTVLDASGSPVAGPTIWAHSHGVNSAQVARADALGAFRVDAVAPQMMLQARSPGFAPSRAEFVVGEKGSRIELRLVLGEKGWPVTGRVLDPEGKPVAGAIVALVPGPSFSDRGSPRTHGLRVHTDDQGAFASDELPQGAVIVSAAGRDPRWIPDSRRVEVGPGAGPVDLRLRIGATIEGRITDGGEPVRDAAVHVFCPQPGMPASYLVEPLKTRSTETDADGRFSLVGILPGPAQMRAMRNGVEALGDRQEQLTEGQTVRWDLDCAEEIALPIDVTVEPPKPPVGDPHWLVVLRPKDGASSSTPAQTTDAEGVARFPRLSDQRYVAVVYCTPQEGRSLELTSREFDPRDRRLVVQIPAERLRFQPLSGRLVDAQGNPRGGCGVQVRPIDSGIGSDLQRATAADGRFTFENLLPGKYRLDALVGSSTRRLRECSVVGDRPEELGDVEVP